MRHYALTGGIGSGKSTVLAMFSALGVPVYSADEAAKLALTNNKNIQDQISVIFGSEAFEGDSLNRSYIAEQVFSNKQKLAALNAIVHPAVKEAYDNWRKKQTAPYTMYEIPLVFELDITDRFDAIVLVVASEEARIQRVQQRDSTTKKAVLARMANQWTDEQKIPHADFIIENNSLDNTQSQVHELHHHFMMRSKK